jgi:predicted Zn-dependent protease
MRICFLIVLLAAPLWGAGGADEIEEAFHRLYNFNFPAAHSLLNNRIAAHPDEPFPYAVRAAAYLFSELDRLGLLEEEFLTDDERIAAKRGLKPDPAVRGRFNQAVQDAQSRAQKVLAAQPNDHDALFTMCMTQGMVTDYMALVEKHQIRSLTPAKTSNRYAQQLLRANPQFYDAYLSTGISEYLVGSLPFFIRWFQHFENVQGSKEKGITNLKLVAERGHYMRPFAKILLGIVYMREKKPRNAERLLAELTEEYPQNPLLRRELDKVHALLRR